MMGLLVVNGVEVEMELDIWAQLAFFGGERNAPKKRQLRPKSVCK